MVKRLALLSQIRHALRRSRVVALIGPRQSGKTTLARQIVPPDSPRYFDLEEPTSLARLAEPAKGSGGDAFVCLVDVEEDVAHLAIVKHGVPYLTRDISLLPAVTLPLPEGGPDEAIPADASQADTISFRMASAPMVLV